MNRPVLVDTSVWIDFLKGRKTAETNFLQLALQLGQARLCGPVKTELLQGAKGDKEKKQLALLFGAVKNLDLVESDWEVAGYRLQALREVGITVPLTDAVISAIAARLQIEILTLDAHFSHL